ncbi:tRNA delta(2)-isopentenylpyrophosphate transferase [Candidatus Scalindua japonica]|uniref:tRNA dimethylallyltransferase n=1 Tax=Candidatus Scalindua japonica TaxID=1284222 RepID=A0A286TZX0_9BACT|nr:tRNA (adenosine(37)-N6)-dimethylallyltransferase MiaA [Candidatus Scalindua japonica]GAX61414.1 tRNA delta(2)-isopentenylpyrophosphate transferase [Candidatus Scalindua japonica]
MSVSEMTITILTGPTACDKTEIGFIAAQMIKGEIISADSMLFYRGMDIGTAKPSPDMKKIVPHHFIDIIDPWESYSVGKYVDDVEALVNNAGSKELKFLIVGGSPLYIKGLVDGIFKGPEADWSIRRELEELAEKKGNKHVHDILQKIDPVKAAEFHPNNLRRIIRAIEVYRITGESLSVLQKKNKQERKGYQFKIICIGRDREDMYRRINERVEIMFDKGLIDEVQSLLNNPRGLSKQAKQALGYKEVIEYLDGGLSLDDVKDMVKLNTRRFAKRQMTWFRGFSDVQWLEAEEHEGPESIAKEIIALYRH